MTVLLKQGTKHTHTHTHTHRGYLICFEALNTLLSLPLLPSNGDFWQ